MRKEYKKKESKKHNKYNTHTNRSGLWNVLFHCLYSDSSMYF